MTPVDTWLATQPLWFVIVAVIVILLVAHALGQWARRRWPGKSPDSDDENPVVAPVLALLGLLLGFTFALAVDRFETRRVLVLDEANAVRTAYLRADTFAEPYRSRLQGLLTAYVDNRLVLGEAENRDHMQRELAADGRLQQAIWRESVTAVATQRDDVSSAFMDSVNTVIELGAARRAARQVHVPRRVFTILLLYMAVSSAMLGFVVGPHHRTSVIVLAGLTALAFFLIVDIDNASRGGIRESQAPMEDLRAFLGAARAPPH